MRTASAAMRASGAFFEVDPDLSEAQLRERAESSFLSDLIRPWDQLHSLIWSDASEARYQRSVALDARVEPTNALVGDMVNHVVEGTPAASGMLWVLFAGSVNTATRAAAAGAPAAGAGRVLVRNTCYTPTGALIGRRVGHTFTKHGSHNTNQLGRQASGSGRQVGQWLDDAGAEELIGANLENLSNGPITVPIPTGMGRVIMPDGSYVSATHARIVPSGSGVRTAYPIILE
jgi:hypothetical protein